MDFKLLTTLVILVLMIGCGASQKNTAGTTGTTTATAANNTDGEHQPNPKDDPRISRSRGEKNGIIILYPRIFPADPDPTLDTLAQALHNRMRRVAEKALPGRAVDMRPAPERECPKAGCLALSVGAVLAHKDGGCVVGALLGPPLTEPRTLVPWAGGFVVKAQAIPFREPAESYIEIADFANCADMDTALDAFEPTIIEALQKLALSNP